MKSAINNLEWEFSNNSIWEGSKESWGVNDVGTNGGVLSQISAMAGEEARHVGEGYVISR